MVYCLYGHSFPDSESHQQSRRFRSPRSRLLAYNIEMAIRHIPHTFVRSDRDSNRLAHVEGHP
jgi:hypothetical protein